MSGCGQDCRLLLIDKQSAKRFYSIFVYPPSVAFLAIPLALFPWSLGRWIMDAVNLLAFLGTWFFTFRLTVVHPNVPARSLAPYLFLACSGLISTTPGLIYIGQMGLIALCGTIGAFYAWQCRHRWLFGVFLVIATFKPQISLFPLLYLILISNPSFVLPGLTFTVTAILSILVSLPPSITDLPAQISDSYSIYKDEPFNRLSYYTSLYGILGDTDLGKMTIVIGVVTLVALLAWLRRRDFAEAPPTDRVAADSQLLNPLTDYLRHLQIMLSAVAFLMPIRAYDLVVYIPVIGTLPIIRRRSFILILLGILFVIGRSRNVETLLGQILGEVFTRNSQFFVHCLTGLFFTMIVIVWVVQSCKYNKPLTPEEVQE